MYFYLYNLQGDVVVIVDETGAVVAEYSYDAWGNVLSATGTLAEINPIRYRGYYYDVEISMYYLHTRYYNPEWGRFINADCMFIAGNVLTASNMYGYCNGDPIAYIDHSGGVAILNRMVSAVIGLARNAIDAVAQAMDAKESVVLVEQGPALKALDMTMAKLSTPVLEKKVGAQSTRWDVIIPWALNPITWINGVIYFLQVIMICFLGTGTAYTTIEAAAFGFLDAVFKKSDRLSVEYSGIIYSKSNGTSYTFSGPLKGASTVSPLELVLIAKI